MTKKILSFLYLPILECNLCCSYCNVRCNSAPSILSRGKADIKKDMEMLVQLAKEKNIEYDCLIHGGEMLLIEPEELAFIFESIYPYSCKKGGIKLQTNLTLLSDEHLAVLVKNKNKIRRVCTTLDFPKTVHNKNRCGSYDQVIVGMRKLLDAGLELSALIGVHNESIENLGLLLSEFNSFREEFPDVKLRFNQIFGNGFTLTTENQIKFANFLIDNNLIEFLYNCNDIKSFLFCCEHLPTCDWIAFHNGVFDHCGVMGYDFDKNKIISRIKKTISEECTECDVVDLCNGGCMGQKMNLKMDKSPYCVFNKITLSYIKQKNNIKEVVHHVCGNLALSEQPVSD